MVFFLRLIAQLYILESNNPTKFIFLKVGCKKTNLVPKLVGMYPDHCNISEHIHFKAIKGFVPLLFQ
ncbi:MAG TPA: hypothetical protein DCQ08_01980 [Amoebophilaceae bacterium]|nr:hypothetical protein [Amoebophilaceae bacterium]